jgi:hypothetical protein
MKEINFLLSIKIPIAEIIAPIKLIWRDKIIVARGAFSIKECTNMKKLSRLNANA